jgi:hypothetical protein
MSERRDLIRDVANVDDGSEFVGVLSQEPLITGFLLTSEDGPTYRVLLQDVRTIADPAPVYAALTWDEHRALQRVAEALADAEELGESVGDVYDPGRSSSGEEYITSPDSAGWYTLVDGRPAQVTVRYVTDPGLIDEVLTELDEVYALSRPEAGSVISDEEYEARLAGVNRDPDYDDIPGACEIEHFETDSGTPPEM